MHAYLTPSDIRLRVYIIASAVALLSAWLLSRLIDVISFPIPWYLDTPSVLGSLGIYLALYDRVLWKSWPMRVLPWFHIPDLNGAWTVRVESSHADFASREDGRATIRQSASRMAISVDYPQSSSNSLTASVLRQNRLSAFELQYHYQSNPKPAAPSTMEIHYGTARLNISDDATNLTGDYYTGRGRLSYGSIHFTKASQFVSTP